MFNAAGIVLIAMAFVATDDPASQRTGVQLTEAEKAKATVAKVVARQKAKEEKLRKELKVYLRDDRRIYVNGTQLSLDLLKKVTRKIKPGKVAIAVEATVKHGRLTEVMNVIEQQGVPRIKFEIQVLNLDGKKVRSVKKPQAK